MNENYSYDIPPKQLYMVRIDRISMLSKMRLLLLREFSRVKNIYDASAPETCSQIYIDYSRRAPEITAIIGNELADVLSFWTLKLAYAHSEEAMNWHLHAESCLLLARAPERSPIVAKIITQRLALAPAASVDFGEAQEIANIYLQKYPSAECTRVEDFPLMSYAIPTFNFAVIGRRFLVVNTQQHTALNLARFGQMYFGSTEKCYQFVQVVQDVDFLYLLQMTRIERLGSAFVQVAYAGEMQLKQLEADIRSGKVPPCMLRLIREMQRKGHLFHEGRLQLYLFLKDAGMVMEDTLALFQQSFTQNGRITLDKFTKEYAYNIRHVYGKAGYGGRSHCFGCEKIIDSIPGTNQVHGCPFRICGASAVAAMYCREIKGLDMEEVLGVIQPPTDAKNYTSACNHLFFKLFGSGMNYPHPVQWVSCSRELERQQTTGESTKE